MKKDKTVDLATPKKPAKKNHSDTPALVQSHIERHAAHFEEKSREIYKHAQVDTSHFEGRHPKPKARAEHLPNTAVIAKRDTKLAIVEHRHGAKRVSAKPKENLVPTRSTVTTTGKSK